MSSPPDKNNFIFRKIRKSNDNDCEVNQFNDNNHRVTARIHVKNLGNTHS